MINGIIATKDLNKSFDFYAKILNIKPICKWHNGAYFTLNDNTWFCINFDEAAAATPDYTHIAFDVTEKDFLKWKNILIQNNISQFKENYSEGNSLYFLDPDGHKLEIHVGNLESRLHAKKKDFGNWEDVIFF